MSRALCSIGVAVALAVAVAGVAASPAFAQAGPIRLVSSNGIEQADFAESPALSADGRFVAFAALMIGERGIFRKDLLNGELVLVAAGEAAQEPSISADGRYVSFTTTAPLDPDDDLKPETSDVYVADLATVPITYELASAIDGCDPRNPEPHAACGLSYESPYSGSAATGRMSLSADGREVAFVARSASNLTEPTAEAGTFPTPPLQVAVRNLETDRTILISGALDPATGLPAPDTPVEGGAVIQAGQRLPAGASISADGSTVAWLAQHPAKQVPVGPDEASPIARLEASSETYDEPLMRRIPGPADATPPTRRIVTGQGFPEMLSGFSLSCANATGWNLGGGQAVPALSGDGGRVAMIGQPNGYTDAFVADVTGSTTSVRRLTTSPLLPGNNACDATQSGFLAGNAEIKTISIAPEGERIAFTTRRQRFPLSPPNLATSPPIGVGSEELYLVDLGASSLERLTHGSTAFSEPSLVEQPGLPGAASVSFAAGGETLAFASPAYNLVPADGNGNGNGAILAGGSDVFTVSDPRSPQAPGKSRISAPPPAIRPQTRWALTAHASSRHDGSVRVAVGVPGAGKLGAVARTETARGRPPVRKVAAARRKALLASVLVFILHPARGLLPQVQAKGGLEATLRLHFAGKGGKPLTAMLNVRFRFHSGKSKKGHAR